MSKWDDQLNNHVINTSLANLAERMKEEVLISDDINVIELVDKINQLLLYSEMCLQNVIPQLVNVGNLNNANSQITNVQNELNNYISNQNIGHLNNAMAHVDAVMVQFNALPMPRPQLTEESFGSSLHKFKNLVESSFNEIKLLKDELEISISEVSEKSVAQNEEISNLSTLVQEHQVNIESQVTKFNEEFESFESEFNEQLALRLTENKEELAKNIEEQKEKFEVQLENHIENGKTVIAGLEENKKQASDLVQIIGNIGITGNYQKIANQEKESADKWRNIALLLMIAMVLVIAITIGISASNGFDWKLALFRIGAALVLAIPATYAAKESNKHRLLENHNRKAELELASLDPFLEKLPEEVRHKVKEELTNKFFGMSNVEVKQDEPVSYSALFDLLKTAISKK